MPAIYLLNLLQSKNDCHIQQKFAGATADGIIQVAPGSNEDFCGEFDGTTSGHVQYTNSSSSSTSS